ncbi:MAG: hypothetical protein ABI073_01975 [Luteolibacter sp.]
MIEVPISEAKELLVVCNGDLQAAYTLAMDRRIGPIVTATRLDRDVVADAFLKNGQNGERTVEYLRYLADPVAFEESRRPKVSELIAAIEQADDVYTMLEACDAYGDPGIEELRVCPQVVQVLVCLGVFYSYYLTDTDALLRYYPTEYHDKIERALRSIGHPSTAERYRQDVTAVLQSNENFSAFLAEQEAFANSLREFCLTHVEEIFSWQMQRNAEAEQATAGQPATRPLSK